MRILCLGIILLAISTGCATPKFAEKSNPPTSQTNPGQPVNIDHLLKNPDQTPAKETVEESVEMESVCWDPERKREYRESDSEYSDCKSENQRSGNYQNLKERIFKKRKAKKGNFTISTEEEI